MVKSDNVHDEITEKVYEKKTDWLSAKSSR